MPRSAWGCALAYYDAFLSYSHAKDKPIAAALQSVIQKLGKPWYVDRKLSVFRDDTSLSATPELWPTIERWLGQSQFLILLASREAAASPWVNKEVAYWLEHKSAKTLLIALTDGELRWDNAIADFVWDHHIPLPPVLRGRLKSEPKWVDLTAYRQGGNTRDAKFAELAADFAAAIHGVPKEDLLFHEMRHQRRALALASTAAFLLLTLTALAGWGWHEAMIQREQRLEPETAGAQAIAPQNAVGYLSRGLAYFAAGNHQRAIDAFGSVIQVHRRSGVTPTGDIDSSASFFGYLYRGRSYVAIGKYNRGIEDYNEAIKLSPTSAVAYLSRSEAYLKVRDFERATADNDYATKLNQTLVNQTLADQGRAISSNPELARVYNGLGRDNLSKKDYDHAIVDFTEAINYDPKYAVAYNNRGLSYSLKGEYDRAIADYSEALKLNPNDSLAHTNLANAYRLKGYNTSPANDDQARERTLKNSTPVRSVPLGVNTQIATHYRIDNQCRPSRVEIMLTAMPAHGTVSSEPKDIVIKAQNGKGEPQPTQCVGETIQGVAVYYQSESNFVGQDSFRYRRINPNDANDRFNAEINYTVAVK